MVAERRTNDVRTACGASATEYAAIVNAVTESTTGSSGAGVVPGADRQRDVRDEDDGVDGDDHRDDQDGPAQQRVERRPNRGGLHQRVPPLEGSDDIGGHERPENGQEDDAGESEAVAL